MNPSREQRRELERENAKWPFILQVVPKYHWQGTPHLPSTMTELWRSRHFLVQIHTAPAPAVCRLSILRLVHNGADFVDGISWEELQGIKRQCGYGNTPAVEIFPADVDIVNVANMRHLWILAEAPAYAWRDR